MCFGYRYNLSTCIVGLLGVGRPSQGGDFNILALDGDAQPSPYSSQQPYCPFFAFFRINFSSSQDTTRHGSAPSTEGNALTSGRSKSRTHSSGGYVPHTKNMHNPEHTDRKRDVRGETRAKGKSGGSERAAAAAAASFYSTLLASGRERTFQYLAVRMFSNTSRQWCIPTHLHDHGLDFGIANQVSTNATTSTSTTTRTRGKNGKV